jgi:hypothetical protein
MHICHAELRILGVHKINIELARYLVMETRAKKDGDWNKVVSGAGCSQLPRYST